MPEPLVQIIIGSTRPGRVGDLVGAWVHECAQTSGLFRAELVDLLDVGLPLLDEPNHPALGQYTHQHTLDWSARVARADAFVLVTPEYNHGPSAALKNALDFLFAEWAHKPVAFVSYGGISAGTRAVGMLKQVVTSLAMVPVLEGVQIPFVKTLVTETPSPDEGVGPTRALAPTASMTKAATAMLTSLSRYALALAPLREVPAAGSA